MSETDPPRMQTQRRSVDVQGLSLSQRIAHQVRRVAANREAQVRKVDANLIRAASDGSGLQQGSAVSNTLPDPKLGAGR